MSRSKTSAPLCQTLHWVFHKAQCWAQYFFFCTSMTCIDPQTSCALFILLTIQRFFASDNDINGVHASVNRELVGVDNWLKTNRLSLNVSKTSYIIISNQKNALDIKIRETILTKVSTVKFLGVTLNENLTFKYHVNKITSNVSKSVGVMRRLHCQLPENPMIKLYSVADLCFGGPDALTAVGAPQSLTVGQHTIVAKVYRLGGETDSAIR